MADDGGLTRIQQRLASIPKVLRDRMKFVTEREAKRVADDMRSLAVPSKDTGALIASIKVTAAGNTTPAYSQPGGSKTVPENAAMITVGNKDVRYPHLVEYGTQKAHAQPFFWPAVRLNKRRVLSAIKREITKTVRAHWGEKP